MTTHMHAPMSHAGFEWRPAPPRSSLPPRIPPRRPPQPYAAMPSLLPLLGLALAGVVILGGIYLAPDFIRYMKIRNM